MEEREREKAIKKISITKKLKHLQIIITEIMLIAKNQ